MLSPQSHIAEVVSALQDQTERDRFVNALKILKEHVIHKREIPNGKDFLFAGTPGPLHDALRDLRDLEQRTSRFLQFDYAQIEGYFLLRIIGKTDHQTMIDSYFDQA